MRPTRAELKKLRTKYPGRIPVVIETDLPLNKKRFLVQRDITVGRFMTILHRRIEVPSESAIYLFVGNDTIPAVSSFMGSVFDEHSNEQGLLYVSARMEDVYG